MHKSKRPLKTMVFSLGLAAMTLTANNLSAQDGGGLFGRGEADAGNRAGESYSLGNQAFGTSLLGGSLGNDGFGNILSGSLGNDDFGNVHNGGITNDDFITPFGGGLPVMMAASAGYAMLRRKKPGDTEI